MRIEDCVSRIGQGPLNGGGGGSNGGFPDLDLSFLFCPFLSFPDFSGIFPICSGMVRGFSRFVPFSPSRPIKSIYEEQSRKGPRHNPDLSRKKVGNPPVWKPPGLASLQLGEQKPCKLKMGVANSMPPIRIDFIDCGIVAKPCKSTL